MAVKDLPEGWLTKDEAKQLAKLAAGKVVLELGAWKGRSTVVMSQTAVLVISVDRHQGINGVDGLPDYLDNVRGLDNVVPVIGQFNVIVPHLVGVDMVYIDGDHDKNSVAADIVLATTFQPNVVAFHDWDFTDVREAGVEAFGTPDGLVGSVAWYTA